MATFIALKQLENANALISASLIGTDLGAAIYQTVDGMTLKNVTMEHLTIVPTDADSYSLIISGAVAVVDATNLTGSLDLELDTSVPAQLWISGQTGSIPPTDPFVNNQPEGNVIDQGEW
jgi:hypothetical protein